MSEILVCKESTIVDVDGVPTPIAKNQTRAWSGSKIARLYPEAFEPIKVHYGEESDDYIPPEPDVDEEDAPAGGDDDAASNDSVAGDKYDQMDYAALQAEAKDRPDVKGNLPAEQLRAALRADDESKA